MVDNYCGEMVLRYIKTNPGPAPMMNTSYKLVEYLKHTLDQDEINTYEFAYLICIARDMSLLGFSRISQGGRGSTIMDPLIIFTTALLRGSSNIILVHNHPSGMLVPSDSDKDITAKVKEGGKILGIHLSDHIIINAEFNYYSFADNGIL